MDDEAPHVGPGRPATPAERWRSLGALHGAVLLFGVAGLFGKWIAAHPLLIVFGRVVVASLTFAALLRRLRLPRTQPTPVEVWLLLTCGVVLAFHWFAFFQSIQVSTVAVGLLAYSTAPVFTVLLEPALGERFSLRSLAAAALCTAGVALIVPRWDPGHALFQGTAWGVAAGFSFALLSLLNRRLVQRHHAIHLALVQDAGATLVLLPLLPLFWRLPTVREVALLVVLGVVCTALAHALYIHSMRRVRAGVAAVSSAMEPVYGIVLAVLLLDEVPAPRTVLGGVLILAAVVWVSLRPSE